MHQLQFSTHFSIDLFRRIYFHRKDTVWQSKASHFERTYYIPYDSSSLAERTSILPHSLAINVYVVFSTPIFLGGMLEMYKGHLDSWNLTDQLKNLERLHGTLRLTKKQNNLIVWKMIAVENIEIHNNYPCYNKKKINNVISPWFFLQLGVLGYESWMINVSEDIYSFCSEPKVISQPSTENF